MKMCIISVAPMPSTMRDAGRLLPGLPGRGGEVLAGRDAGRAGVGDVVARPAAGSSPCRRSARWRGWSPRGAAIASSSGLGPGVSIVTAAPPKRQGKISSMPSPKVKAIGAEQAQRSPGRGLQHMAGEAVGAGEDVAVIMDAALGLAGRARGEGDQGDVVAMRCRPARSRARPSSSPSKPVVAVISEDRADPAGGVEIVAEAGVDDGVADPGALEDRRDLAGAEHRHGRDDHAAGLEHAEPGGEQHRVVGPAQEARGCRGRGPPRSTSRRAIRSDRSLISP